MTGCANHEDARWTKDPVGSPVLPDLMPVPPTDLHTRKDPRGWVIEFSSTLVNVGKGDFHATAERMANGPWTVTQDIAYDGGGSDHVTIAAEPVWAGDGHEHWHLKRVVSYRLYALGPGGRVTTGPPRTDHKIGFCIYDFRAQHLGYGPKKAVYGREGCGRPDSTRLVMGLSPGWGDFYHWHLPGQSIDIGGLADGPYRIFAMADEGHVMREATVANNRTWVDFELSTDPQGNRLAKITHVGPAPGDRP